MILTEEYQELIKKYYNADLDALHLQSFPDHIDVTFLYNQIKGRKKAAEKLPTWYSINQIIYPEYISLEQCSSEFTSRRKALFFNNKTVLDMTGGLGIDAFFINQQASSYTMLETNSELSKIVRHNFEVLGAEDIVVVNSESVGFLKSETKEYDIIYLDPARRKEAESDKLTRVFALEDFRPNVLEIKDLLFRKASSVCIKLPPMLDVTALQKQLPEISKVVTIAYKNEVKELLIFLDKLNENPKYIAINLLDAKGNEEYFSNETLRSDSVSLSEIKKYVYEPNKAILKLGLQDKHAIEQHLKKLDDFTHLYTSDNYCDSFQGRVFEIIKHLPAKPKSFKKEFGENKANIISRNHPLKANQLHKRFGLKSGGEHYILAGSSLNKKFIVQAKRVK